MRSRPLRGECFNRGTAARPTSSPGAEAVFMTTSAPAAERTSSMREVVVVSGCRTAQGTFGGALRDVPAHELATAMVRAIVKRTGIEGDQIGGVAIGQVYQTSEALNIARFSAIAAGLPSSVNGYSLNAACCSSLEAFCA